MSQVKNMYCTADLKIDLNLIINFHQVKLNVISYQHLSVICSSRAIWEAKYSKLQENVFLESILCQITCRAKFYLETPFVANFLSFQTS